MIQEVVKINRSTISLLGTELIPCAVERRYVVIDMNGNSNINPSKELAYRECPFALGRLGARQGINAHFDALIGDVEYSPDIHRLLPPEEVYHKTEAGKRQRDYLDLCDWEFLGSANDTLG